MKGGECMDTKREVQVITRQEEQYPEKRDFCFLWCHTAYAIESKRETRVDGICPKVKGARR